MGRSILVIENDESLQSLMKDWLQTVFLDCRIAVAADNGQTGAATISQPPDVILVDVDTLNRRVVDAVGNLRTAAPDAEIIAMAMEDHEALREDVAAAGARACVRKSDLSDRLLPMLNEILDDGDGLFSQGSGTKTVLCIEDELEMIKLIEYTLQRGPFQVLGAVSGQQGLDVARQVRPDVVLLDLMMPDMDGWEVARRLRAEKELKDVPIIAVSVVHPSSYPSRELEVDDYVTKPFVPDDLLRRVGKIAQTVA